MTDAQRLTDALGRRPEVAREDANDHRPHGEDQAGD